MSRSAIRVAFDSGPLYGHRTGVGVAVDGMATALARRRTVELVPYLVSFRANPPSGERRLPLPGIVASHLWARTNVPNMGRWLGTADLVHGTNYVAPPTRLPTVISVYDCWFLRHPELAQPVVTRAGKILARRASEGAWVHTSSQATADELSHLLDTDRVRVVHLGIAPRTAGLDPAPSSTLMAPFIPNDSRPLLVAIGTEERRKGYPTLVRAFDLLAERDPDVMLVLAGKPGDDSTEIDNAMGDLAPQHRRRIHRLGPVPDATKNALLSRAAALVYPSLDEGFGFPVLEAQQVGVPVVASNAGSIPEVAGGAAILVEPDDVEALAAGIESVISDSALRASLTSDGYDNVARFSWEATADGLIDLYEEALQ